MDGIDIATAKLVSDLASYQIMGFNMPVAVLTVPVVDLFITMEI